MDAIRRSPAWAQRVLFGAIVVYFVTLFVSMAIDSLALVLVSNGLFGCIAIGVGVLLYAEAATADSALTVAALLLGLGGVAQLVWVGTAALGMALVAADSVASLLVFAGIAAYVYAVWVA